MPCVTQSQWHKRKQWPVSSITDANTACSNVCRFTLALYFPVCCASNRTLTISQQKEGIFSNILRECCNIWDQVIFVIDIVFMIIVVYMHESVCVLMWIHYWQLRMYLYIRIYVFDYKITHLAGRTTLPTFPNRSPFHSKTASKYNLGGYPDNACV